MFTSNFLSFHGYFIMFSLEERQGECFQRSIIWSRCFNVVVSLFFGDYLSVQRAHRPPASMQFFLDFFLLNVYQNLLPSHNLLRNPCSVCNWGGKRKQLSTLFQHALSTIPRVSIRKLQGNRNHFPPQKDYYSTSSYNASKLHLNTYI